MYAWMEYFPFGTTLPGIVNICFHCFTANKQTNDKYVIIYFCQQQKRLNVSSIKELLKVKYTESETKISFHFFV